MRPEDLLDLLTQLRDADLRLAAAGRDPRARAQALREVRRLERLAFADALRPAPRPVAREAAAEG